MTLHELGAQSGYFAIFPTHSEQMQELEKMLMSDGMAHQEITLVDRQDSVRSKTFKNI